MITLLLGLPGSGKTTRMLSMIKDSNRVVIYSPYVADDRTPPGIPQVSDYPSIPDNPEYFTKGIEYYFEQTPQFVINARGNSTFIFNQCMDLSNCVLVLDDLPAIAGETGEDRALLKLLPVLRWRRIEVILTAHLPKSDVLKKLRVISDHIWWFGPLSDEDEIKTLWGLRRTDQGINEFYNKLKTQPKFECTQIR